MTPLLSVWPSELTEFLALKVSARMEESGGGKVMHRAMRCASMTAAELAAKISAAYREMMPLDAVDTVLHTVVVLPLWEEDSLDRLRKVTEAVRLCPDQISLLVIGLQENLRHICEPDIDPASRSLMREKEEVEKRIATLCKGEGKASPRVSLTVIDDYIVNGAPIGFTLKSLSLYLSAFFMSLCEAYHSVLPPALFAGGEERLGAVGLSSLTFDRRRVSEYLLHKAFQAALDRVNINQENVSAQGAVTRAQAILAGIQERYPSFFNREILPLYRETDKSEGTVAAEADPLLAAEFRRLEEDLTAFLDDESLSLPEKEAIMAMIIGRDNPRLRGVSYDESFLLIDDAARKPVELYLDTFNELVPGSGLLPLRGDYPALKKYVRDSDGASTEAPENSRAFDPLPEIKRLKREILDTTAFIRRKTDELQELIEADKTRRAVEEDQREHGGFGERYPREEIREQPLDDTYVPGAGVRPMESVDLREYFSPVRDQGKLGSCSTFATVSMYEAIMNRFASAGAEKAILGERFVYYYSNVLPGRPEGGSNYYEQLSVLGKHGTCQETLFGYSTENLSEAPAEEAIEDAMRHRVLKALQIPMRENGTEEENIRENHRLMTSALTEGYPVGISLRLFEGFGDDGPYISCPDESAVPDGNHAMVLVGYSEAEKCYIVRNSWGERFGDKGYCYISAAYIDNPRYNFFSCIIAETTESEHGTGGKVAPVTSAFAGTETQINIAAIRNILDEAYAILRSRQQLYNEHYKYYRALMQRLCMPQVRTKLRQAAEGNSLEGFAALAGRRSRMEEEFAGIMNAFRSGYRKTALGISAVAFVYDVIAVALTLSGDYDFNTWIGWSVGIVLTIAAIFVWLNYKWAVRKKRRRLDGELGDLAVAESRAKRDLLETQIRFHVAGMWIDRLHDLTLGLEKIYNRLVSYNDYLKAWYAEDARKAAAPLLPEGSMFLNPADPALLDRFFLENLEAITGNIDLMETFRNYRVDSETIEEARRRLSAAVTEAISALFADFRLSDYLLGLRSYPYLPEVSLEETLTSMLRLGQPSTRHVTTGLSTPMRLLLINLPAPQTPLWHERVSPSFPLVPLTVPTVLPDTLLLLTVQPLPPASLR